MAQVESSSACGCTSYTQILETTAINNVLASNYGSIVWSSYEWEFAHVSGEKL